MRHRYTHRVVPLSAVLIAQNEEKGIGDALASAWGALRTERRRSLLALTGTAIGVAAVLGCADEIGPPWACMVLPPPGTGAVAPPGSGGGRGTPAAGCTDGEWSH